MLWTLVLSVIAISTPGIVGDNGDSSEVTDEEYALFPRLFHLDDYDGCMLKADALYCLGTFHISGGTSPALQMLETYSKDVNNFNRTLLHRGYCVSERCPLRSTTFAQCPSEHQDAKANNFTSHTIRLQYPHLHNNSNACANNVLRFQRCVSKYARRQNLQVQLSSLQYCHTKQDLKEWKVETPHLVFLGVVGLMLLLNLVGTIYDETSSSANNQLLTSWSIRRNWQHLVGNFPDDDPRLSTLLIVDGIRCLLLFVIIFAHAGCIHAQLYLGNPRQLELLSRQPFMMLFHNGHSVIQVFTLLSAFLLAQGVMRAPPSFNALPGLLVKRVLRIAPVYLLAVGYAATWWPRAGAGPLWALVEAESAVCRDKFWPLAFFLGNFFDENRICLLQNWFFQVDMQLYVFALVLTVVLTRARRSALGVLAVLLAGTCAACAALAYRADWAPLAVTAGPENIRTLFSSVEQFHGFYLKPWASAGACLVGLILAHLQHRLQEEGFHQKTHKRLFAWCQLGVPLMPLWLCGAGHAFRAASSRGARAALVALERPIVALIAGVVFFGAYNGRNLAKTGSVKATPTNGFVKRLFSWRGLYPLGRMSLAALMLHWIVNKTFAASRHGLYYSNTMEMTIDCVATLVFSLLLALPVTLLLDIPMQQLYRAATTSSPTLQAGAVTTKSKST